MSGPNFTEGGGKHPPQCCTGRKKVHLCYHWHSLQLQKLKKSKRFLTRRVGFDADCIILFRAKTKICQKPKVRDKDFLNGCPWCDQGAEGRGEQRRGLRTKALIRDLGTRLECRQRVFVRSGKHCGSKSIVA